MIDRIVFMTLGLWSAAALAQDVPGIEICTVDKTMERRTSCLQSNVEFLVKTIGRLRSDHDRKLDAANREIAALKENVAALQKTVEDLHSAKPAPSAEPKKPEALSASPSAAK